MPIDYHAARELLEKTLSEVAEAALNKEASPTVTDLLVEPCSVVFASSTQSFREALLGCVVAKLQDQSIDVRKPYVNQGPNAYNGRTLDEQAINPFFHDHRIPSSKGPFLNVFRRSVGFDSSTRHGLRDKEGFDAMLACVQYVDAAKKPEELLQLLRYMLFRFVELRELATVPLTRIHRFSLQQYATLIDGLLSVASGGRFPVFLIVSAFKAISERFGLGWNIEYQGINVADGASGAGGDVTISRDSKLLMAAEITERPVVRERVVSTFNTKIGPNGIEDYLFFVTQEPAEKARQQCQQYFAQGHEVSFVQIAIWLNMMLATIGKDGRLVFNQELIAMLEDQATPQSVRAAWNECVASVIEIA